MPFENDVYRGFVITREDAYSEKRCVQKEATELYVQHKHTRAKTKPNKTYKQKKETPGTHTPQETSLGGRIESFFKNTFLYLPIVYLFFYKGTWTGLKWKITLTSSFLP